MWHHLGAFTFIFVCFETGAALCKNVVLSCGLLRFGRETTLYLEWFGFAHGRLTRLFANWERVFVCVNLVPSLHLLILLHLTVGEKLLD